MDQKDSAVMLTSIQSAGVTPEVNLRIKHADEKAHKKGSTQALKPRADIIRSPKQGYQWPHKKDLCPLKKINEAPPVGGSKWFAHLPIPKKLIYTSLHYAHFITHVTIS